MCNYRRYANPSGKRKTAKRKKPLAVHNASVLKPKAHQRTATWLTATSRSELHRVFSFTMCRWYCLSEGPSTNLKCLQCGARYCGACLHGDFPGKMDSLIKCGKCGKKPQVKANSERSGWKNVPADMPPVLPAARVRVNSMNEREAGDIFLSNLRTGPSPARTPIAGRRAQSPVPHSPSLPESATLQQVYMEFSWFGDHSTSLDGAKFVKLCKDCGLSPSKLSIVDAELIFSKVKPGTERRINFDQFIDALHLIAQKAYPGDGASSAYDHVAQQVMSCPRPKAQGTTTSVGGIFDKLTDPSLYTGAHKLRFDANGVGRGLAGRDSAAKGLGHVPRRI